MVKIFEITALENIKKSQTGFPLAGHDSIRVKFSLTSNQISISVGIGNKPKATNSFDPN